MKVQIASLALASKQLRQSHTNEVAAFVGCFGATAKTTLTSLAAKFVSHCGAKTKSYTCASVLVSQLRTTILFETKRVQLLWVASVLGKAVKHKYIEIQFSIANLRHAGFTQHHSINIYEYLFIYLCTYIYIYTICIISTYKATQQ